jgi:hypothetical protein
MVMNAAGLPARGAKGEGGRSRDVPSEVAVREPRREGKASYSQSWLAHTCTMLPVPNNLLRRILLSSLPHTAHARLSRGAVLQHFRKQLAAKPAWVQCLMGMQARCITV